MKIQYLGTAAAEGWPALFCQCDPCMRAKEAGGKNVRTRSSVLINDISLVDFPPDTYLHVLRDRLELGEIEHIFITHSHTDHLYLSDLAMRSKPYAHLKKEKKLMLWGNQVVTGMLDERSSAFTTIQSNTVKPGDTFQAGELTITALKADHMRDEDALLFIICDAEKGIFYAHDSGWYPEETWQWLAGKELDLVNFDCTFGPISNRHGHMGISEILEAREKMWDIGAIKRETKCVITHFSHNSGLLHQELVQHVAGTGLIVAYDGMIIEI